jgi:multiple sugar transport system permease protein
MKLSRLTWRIIGLIVLLGFTAFFFVPVVWVLLATTKSDAQLTSWGPFTFGTFGHFIDAWKALFGFQSDAMIGWLKNSAIYSFGGVAIAIVAAVPAGYGLALTQFIGRRTLLAITLITMIMPATALVLPLFLEMNSVSLTDTAWSVILPFSFFPFGVYLCYIFFSSTIPKDLLAAARVDGCNEWGVFRYIAMPLARPVVALVAFFAFVADWNNYYLPFVMLASNNKLPVQVGLEYLISSTEAFNPGNPGTGAQLVHRPELALAILVAIAPVAIVFLFAQRTLVKGMLAGATKE